MSAPAVSVPPGRAGRLRLDRRLAAARSGADLLDRKVRILTAELASLQETARQTSLRWHSMARDADERLLDASLLGGQRAIRRAMPRDLGAVELTYAVTVGVRHPAGGSYAPPETPDCWTGQAIDAARRAYQAALAAAVAHATAAAAVRAIATEAAATRIRLRAIRDRLIPRLEQALADVILAIDEQERGDAVRLRLAESARVRPPPVPEPGA